MTVTMLYFTFDLPGVSSLKGRRAVTNGMKERLRQFNVSILDISSEYSREAVLAVAYLSPSASDAAHYREKIESMLERNFPEWPYELSSECL